MTSTEKHNTTPPDIQTNFTRRCTDITTPTEQFFICDLCGKRKPTTQWAGRCVICQQNVCSLCARLEHEKLYCERHVPIVQVPEEPKRRCFIATAAYGTPMAKEIDTLRNFRDQKLQETTIGQKLVTTYYTISPSIANIIDRNEALRKTTRFCIDPLVHMLKKRGY